MEKQQIILDGDSFHNLSSFYDEVERKLTKDLIWDFGRNLAAFNDVLGGGFGVFDDEPIKLIWRNSAKSQLDLSWPETISFLENNLLRCHPSNIDHIKSELQQAKKKKGKTIYDTLIEIIKSHDHIELVLS